MKDARIELRVSKKQLREWRAEAKRSEMTLSDWIRERCTATRVYRTKAGWYKLSGFNWWGRP